MDWAKQALRQRRLARQAREWAAIHEARADAYERRAEKTPGPISVVPAPVKPRSLGRD